MNYETKKAHCNEILQTMALLEDALFGDMTLADYPELTKVLDDRGERAIKRINDAIMFNVGCIMGDSNTFGTYEHSTKRLTIACDDNGMFDFSNLAHEMIHYYEESIREVDEGILQMLAIDTYRKLEGHIDNLRELALTHMELTSHRELENCGGRHDLLFYLKSLDVDDLLELPLNTTMGYGYEKIADSCSTR